MKKKKKTTTKAAPKKKVKTTKAAPAKVAKKVFVVTEKKVVPKRGATSKTKKKAAATTKVATKVATKASSTGAFPTDEAGWQVYADALQSKGDPRGEVMAIQSALAKKPQDAKLRDAERKAIAPLLKGKLKDYLARFTKMAETLKKDGAKVFLGFFPNAPASEREILEVEAALGYALDDSIKTFYRQTNGLQLFVIDKDAENFDADLHKPLKTPVGSENYRIIESPGPTHSVNILSLKECFLSDYSEQLYFDFMNDSEMSDFGKKKYPQLSFHKSLRIFDQMTDYYQMGFALIENTGSPPFAFANDYGASWTDSKITDCAEYLETTLKHRGLIDARKSHYDKW